jgi:tetratricopeptide (TPR) repeat protein
MHAIAAVLLLTTAAPGQAPAPAPAPAKAAAPAEFPSSCNAQAKPLIAAGFQAIFNARIDEARAKIKEAVAADPKCGLAKGFLGTITPDGKKLVEEAAGMTAGATEVEKLFLQAIVADGAGDAQKAFELMMKARDLAPNVLMLNVMVSGRAGGLHRYDDMLAAAKKSTELDPKAGAAWNQLGYAYVNKKQWDDAVGAFKKYVEIAPTEANAHDSLADALMWSGKIDEAATEYQKAVDAKMPMSLNGVAAVKAIKGDWAGARTACDALHEASSDPEVKVEALWWKGVAFAGEGKLADAVKTLEQSEKEATDAKLEFQAAIAPIIRGNLLLDAGKTADAIKQFALAEKAKVDTVTEGDKRKVNGFRLLGLAEAQARSGKAADAEKTVAKLEEVYKAVPADVQGQELVAHARGFALIAKKDFKGAVEALSKCGDDADLCRVTLAEAQEKAGDAAAATATREQVMAANHRNPMYLEARAKLAAAAPGKKVAAETKKK